MSTIKVDTIATRTGSGNITLSNSLADVTINRTGNGVAQTIQNSGTTVGQIGVNSTDNMYFVSTNTGFKLLKDEAAIAPAQSGGSNHDNALDLGVSTVRWKDLYLSGGAYIGGAVAANKLDDYEEGTFTPVPVVTHNPGSVSISNISNQVGVYVKVGSMVFFHLRVRFDKSGSSGNIGINGMPFTANSIIPYGNIGMAREGNSEGVAYQFESMATTQIGVIRKYDNTGFGTGTKDVQGHGFYRTDS